MTFITLERVELKRDGLSCSLKTPRPTVEVSTGRVGATQTRGGLKLLFALGILEPKWRQNATRSNNPPTIEKETQNDFVNKLDSHQPRIPQYYKLL